MKSLRIVTAVALAVLGATPVAMATGPCKPDLTPITIFPMVLCVEREGTTNANCTDPNNCSGTSGNSAANIFPWTNLGGTFSSYRNQYLYPSSALAKLRALTIESIHSRTSSFTATGTQTHTYTGGNITIGIVPTGTLVNDFATNLSGINTKISIPISGSGLINEISGAQVGSPFGATNTAPILSNMAFRTGSDQTRNDIPVIDLSPVKTNPPDSTFNIIVDTLLSGTGGSGVSAWDVTAPACSEPKRAYGSRPGIGGNANWLTTALGVDNNAFVWVFRGKALPPPSTVQQQIAEIIRLLVTPEGLRCTGLDLNPNDGGNLQENPILVRYRQGLQSNLAPGHQRWLEDRRRERRRWQASPGLVAVVDRQTGETQATLNRWRARVAPASASRSGSTGLIHSSRL